MCSSTKAPSPPPPPPPPAEPPKMMTPEEVANSSANSTGGIRAASGARSKLRIDLGTGGSKGSGLNLPV